MVSDGVDYQNGNGADIGASKAVSFSSLRPKLVVPVAFYKSAFGEEEVPEGTYERIVIKMQVHGCSSYQKVVRSIYH